MERAAAVQIRSLPSACVAELAETWASVAGGAADSAAFQPAAVLARRAEIQKRCAACCAGERAARRYLDSGFSAVFHRALLSGPWPLSANFVFCPKYLSFLTLGRYSFSSGCPGAVRLAAGRLPRHAPILGYPSGRFHAHLYTAHLPLFRDTSEYIQNPRS